MKTFSALYPLFPVLLFCVLNTSNAQNTKYGTRALYSNTTGRRNSAFGYHSLYSNTTGSDNTGVGHFALLSNTSGYSNIAIGTNALNKNTVGHNIVAVGDSALFNQKVNSLDYYFNTAVGSKALYSNSTGPFNTATGSHALEGNITGDHNTANGTFALSANTTGIENTAIGSSAQLFNTTGKDNTACGIAALYFNTTGNYNTAFGSQAGSGLSNGNRNTFTGYDANSDFEGAVRNSTALGNGSRVSSNNTVRIGNASIVSIGGFVNWSNISDGRFKKNIKDDIKGLEFILKLKPVSYTLDVTSINNFFDKDAKTVNGEKHIVEEQDVQAIKEKEQVVYNGFVAQDVEKTAKEINYNFSGVDVPKNKNDVYGLRYSDFVVPLVKAVQELSQQNDSLKRRDNELEARLVKLESMVFALQSQTSSQSIESGSVSGLGQNIPNPFNGTTTISYYLSEKSKDAYINFYSSSGTLLKSLRLTEGKGTVNLKAGELAAGVYRYCLVMDGKVIDTKQMVQSK